MAIVLEIRDRGRPERPHTVTFASVPLALGRAAANDVPLPDPEVSSAHAQIVYQDRPPDSGETPRLALIDLGSANGTLVEGKNAPPRRVVPLHSGQTISIGRYDIRLTANAAPAPATARTAEVTARSLAREQLAGSDGPSRFLRVTTGPEAGRRLSLERTGEHVLGRVSGAGLRVDDPGLPPRAALIQVSDTTVAVNNLTGDSAAPGVLVNGAPADPTRPLRDGDRITVGSVSLEFVDRSEALLGKMAQPHAADALRPMGEGADADEEADVWIRRVEPLMDAAAAVLGGAAVTAALVLIAWAVGL